VLLAASKAEQLQSWEAAAAFGLIALLASRFIPRINREINRGGRRMPWPFRLLYPSGEREERMISFQQRSVYWVGMGFFVVGLTGLVVRLLLP
jgi:hypothetical protein